MTHLADSMSLRPFRLADAVAIEPWLAGPGLSLPGGAARRDWPERLLADHRILVQIAEQGGRQIGLVRLDCGPDRVAEVTLVVAPECRRRGHGRAIMQAAIVQARGIGLRQLVASVDLGNTTALEFFQDIGFVPDGRNGNRLRLVRDVHAGTGRPPLVVEL